MDIISQFEFVKSVPMGEVSETLNLSILTTQNINPKSKVQLDGWTKIDPGKRTVQIDRTTEIGEQIAQQFISFITRAFGEKTFRHTRLRKRKSLANPTLSLFHLLQKI